MLFFGSFPRVWPYSGNQLIFLEIVFFPSKRMECYLFNNWISSYLGFYTMYQFLLSYNLLALALELFVFFSCLECSSSWTQCSFYSIKVLLSIKKKKNLFNNRFYMFWDFKKKKKKKRFCSCGGPLVSFLWFLLAGSERLLIKYFFIDYFSFWYRWFEMTVEQIFGAYMQGGTKSKEIWQCALNPS